MNKLTWKALAKQLEENQSVSDYERVLAKRMEAEGGSIILNVERPSKASKRSVKNFR